MRVAIVGGSLGGLFAAALLRGAGHEVQIFERSRSGLEGRGAGLMGRREISAILRAAGCEHVPCGEVLPRERVLLDRSGAVLRRRAATQRQIAWDNLFHIFHSLIGEQEYRTNRAVTAVEQDPEIAWLNFADGERVQADLIVGADGVGSVTRRSVTGSGDEPRYAGYVAWRGLFPEASLPPLAADLLLDRFALYEMPRSHVLGYVVAGPHGETARGQRRYNWVWYRRAPDLASALTDPSGRVEHYSLAPGMVAESAREEMLLRARELLPEAFVEAIAAEPHPFVQAIFDYEAPRMVRGRLALLGDAAFVVRPHTAMGVAKAAGDAMALAAALAEHPLPAALAAYESERMPRNRATAAFGRRLGRPLE